MIATIAQLVDNHGFDVLEHLDREAEIPVLAGLQLQGDLAVIPSAAPGPAARGGRQTVPAGGVAVIEAVGAGHEHRLFAGSPGTAFWTPARSAGQDIGVLECTAPAFVAHPEHGYAGLAPGAYLLRRQREQADEERLVAD